MITTVDHYSYAMKAFNNSSNKGFWESPRDPSMIVLLILSEVSEALEADRKDLKDDKLTDIDGFIVEMADAYIRLADLLGSYDDDGDESGILQSYDINYELQIPLVMMSVTRWEFMYEVSKRSVDLRNKISAASVDDRGTVQVIEHTVAIMHYIVSNMSQYGDFMSIVDSKMDFNKNRPHKHGKKY